MTLHPGSLDILAASARPPSQLLSGGKLRRASVRYAERGVPVSKSKQRPEFTVDGASWSFERRHWLMQIGRRPRGSRGGGPSEVSNLS